MPLTISEGSNNTAQDETSEIENAQQHLRTLSVDMDEENTERNLCRTVKNIVYVPVMRVPILVPDTVNAYLAFRAAIKAGKLTPW